MIAMVIVLMLAACDQKPQQFQTINPGQPFVVIDGRIYVKG